MTNDNFSASVPNNFNQSCGYKISSRSQKYPNVNAVVVTVCLKSVTLYFTRALNIKFLRTGSSDGGSPLIRNTTGANYDPHLVHTAQHLHTIYTLSKHYLHTIYTIQTVSTHTTLIYIKYPACVWAGAMISLITMVWWSHYMCNVYQDYQVPSSRLLSIQVPDTAEDWGHLSQVWTPHVAAVTSPLDILPYSNPAMMAWIRSQ